MTETDVAGVLRDALWLLLKLGAPMLLATLAMGLVVSLVQTVTQINEPTLVFVPKLLALGGTMILLGSYMSGQMIAFTQMVMDRLISVGGQ